MREIKFRLRLDIQIVGYCKWYSGERAQDETMPDGYKYWRANPCWLYSYDNIRWTPEPIFHNYKDAHIGLQDKNGKEIYEGDIVQSFNDFGLPELQEYTNYVIEWLCGAMGVGFSLKGEEAHKMWLCGAMGVGFSLKGEEAHKMLNENLVHNLELKVIGNIYENPDLLGGKVNENL